MLIIGGIVVVVLIVIFLMMRGCGSPPWMTRAGFESIIDLAGGPKADATDLFDALDADKDDCISEAEVKAAAIAIKATGTTGGSGATATTSKYDAIKAAFKKSS